MRSGPRRTGNTIAALAVMGMTTPAAGDSCAPRVEEDPRWRSATVRVHTDAFRECVLDEAGYNRLLEDWLAARDPSAPMPDSISLGRLIRHPWIASHLARSALHHAAWDAALGRARAGHANAAVVTLLSTPEFIARLQRPLAGHGVQVRGLSVEKVLVDEARTVIGGDAPATRRVPFDAQVWLVLEVRQ